MTLLLLRAGFGTALLALISGVLVGGDWMRISLVVAGALLILVVAPIALLDVGGKLKRAIVDAGSPGFAWVLPVFGTAALLVGLFLVISGLVGGASVTKPGLIR